MVIRLGNGWYFGKLVPEERWSQPEVVEKQMLHCTPQKQMSYYTLPHNNDHYSTSATFLSLQAGRCGEVRLYKKDIYEIPVFFFSSLKFYFFVARSEDIIFIFNFKC